MFKKTLLIGALCAASLLLQTSAAHAVIIGGGVTGGSGGTIAQEFSPAVGTIGNNNINQNILYGFNELQNTALSKTITTNIGVSSIAAGTVVSSHYIFFDPAASTRVIGYADFDAPIIGIITSSTKLGNSDFLNNTAVVYVNKNNRGLESVDHLSIDSSNPNRILIDLTASSPGDYFRVITGPTPTPEPASMMLLALGLGGLGMLRRKQI